MTHCLMRIEQNAKNMFLQFCLTNSKISFDTLLVGGGGVVRHIGQGGARALTGSLHCTAPGKAAYH